MDNSQLEQQVIDLQARVAFQEDTIADLDQVVTEQQTQLLRVNEMLNALRDRLEQLEEGKGDGGVQGAALERPPHY